MQVTIFSPGSRTGAATPYSVCSYNRVGTHDQACGDSVLGLRSRLCNRRERVLRPGPDNTPRSFTPSVVGPIHLYCLFSVLTPRRDSSCSPNHARIPTLEVGMSQYIVKNQTDSPIPSPRMTAVHSPLLKGRSKPAWV